ncbi:MAG: hypothetical protein ABSA78_18390 [Candidatus Sulfotelmatobacter sp.]|jgi:hypothetical protein
MPHLDLCLALFSVKDWADLLHAAAWPIVALIAIFRFHGVIESLLERVIRVEGLGVKATMAKLDKEIPKAEMEAKRLKPKQPDIPTTGN